MLQIWRNVGNVTERAVPERSHGEDRTVSGCAGPRKGGYRRGKNIRAPSNVGGAPIADVDRATLAST